MYSPPRAALAVSLALVLSLAGLPALGQQPPTGFSHPIVSRDADRLDLSLKALRESPAGQQMLTTSGAVHRATGLQHLAEAKDLRAAIRSLTLAVAADPRDWMAWTALAEAYLAVVPDPAGNAERYDLPANAAGAAWRGYERAPDKAARARALAVLAEALKRRSMWTPAIDALKASLGLDAQPTVEAVLETLRAEHGFRVVDYKIDSDAPAPRLCVNFSDRVASLATPDLAKFAVLDGREPESLAAEGNQVCIDGLKHGTRYTLQMRAGLTAANGEILSKSSEIAVYVRDRKPSVRLAGRAYVLPSRGQQGIPVTSVNTKSLDIEILRIGDRGLGLVAGNDGFLKSIESWELDRVRESHGQRVWQGTLDVGDRLNEDVTTAIPVAEALKTLQPGAYIVSAAISGKANGEGSQARAAQWFIVSDIGLTALSGDDGLHVFARSLVSTTAVTGVTLRLIARNNEVLATAKTDARGYARFDAGLVKGEGGLAPRLLTAEGNGDYALLDIATAAFDLADRGVKGRPQPGPLDGYLFAERGVYRPGETVHLTGLVRTAQNAAATVPATLILTRPDGVEHRRITLGDQGLGGRTASIALASSSMTGTWRAKLHADPKSAPLAETAFLVEDFVPERLALTLTPASPAVGAGEPARINLAGRYLYGPPAAGLALEGDVVVRAAKGSIAGFPGYHFGIDGETFPAVRGTIANPGRTSADGTASLQAVLPDRKATSLPLEAEVIVRLREPAGRSIERKVTLPIHDGEPRIGIKPLFANGQIGEGDEAAFDVIAVDGDGKAQATAAVTWEIVRLDRRWQWYAQDGDWRYEPITTTRRMTTGTAAIADGKPARITFKPEWGRYRLDVTMPGNRRSTVLFSAGWQPSDNADSPEVLDIALDKGSYSAGETARLKITSREAGRALVTVVSNGLLSTQDVDVPKGGTQVAIPVDRSWMPGAYVTATLYRALDEGSRRMPGRAMGVAWLGFETKTRTLALGLATPEKAMPGRTLTIPVSVGGLAAGEEARVTVAAVDIGILNLTRYEAPAPERWFLGQRRLGVEVRDLYGRLIDGMRAERGRLRSGGDGTGGLASEGSPPVEAPLALFSGIVKVAADGTAKVDFALPDFNGQVRIMAVAWSGSKVGSASRTVIVRDKLALTATAPRFLTLGDEARLDLDIHNVDGPAASYRVVVDQETADGSRQSLSSMDLVIKPSERHRENLRLKPAGLGRSVFDVKVAGPDGIEVRRRLVLDIKAPAVGIRRSTVAQLAAGGRLTLSRDLFHDLIPTSARLSLSVGRTAAFDVAGLLGQLDRYPYGCAEQTTSRALPLLYVNDMAKRLGLHEEAEIKTRVANAIDRLAEMQDGSGAFGIWGPSDGDMWLTAYVTDFLTRAKEAGFPIRQAPFTQALDRLANHLAYAQDFEKGGEDRAYALYVLARNGRAPVGDLRYYADTRLERFATPLAKAHIAAALALIGDQARAGSAFAAALAGLEGTDIKALDASRRDYGSLVRDGAGVLTLAAETGVAKDRQPDLGRVVAAAFRNRLATSTQEQAWMLMAARAITEEAKATSLAIAGKPHAGEFSRRWLPAELANGPIDITNTGASAVDTVITVEGSSLTPEPAISHGFTIERAYYTLEGTRVDLASANGGTATIAQNTRLVAVLTINGSESGGRVLLVDRLPAGLEVENPRLVDSGDVKVFPWLKREREPQHTEFRDDRVIAAFSFFGDGNGNRNGDNASLPSRATIAYLVRAVTPGNFAHPAAAVEDMYRPGQFARTAAGRLIVTEQK